jgi:hypothetical protein
MLFWKQNRTSVVQYVGAVTMTKNIRSIPVAIVENCFCAGQWAIELAGTYSATPPFSLIISKDAGYCELCHFHCQSSWRICKATSWFQYH